MRFQYTLRWAGAIYAIVRIFCHFLGVSSVISSRQASSCRLVDSKSQLRRRSANPRDFVSW